MNPYYHLFFLFWFFNIFFLSLCQNVDVNTLYGKIVTGYQGWFATPHDGYEKGWFHYANNRNPGVFTPNSNSIEFIPDISEFGQDEIYPTDLRHTDGRVMGVFSSSNSKTVNRHFLWMKNYGIECAFVQRFLAQIMNSNDARFTDKVLQNIREASKAHGRTYTIMYDLSGPSLSEYTFIKKDWEKLTKVYGILRDQNYQKHLGRPVITLWGIGFSDRHRDRVREYLEHCMDLVRFFKEQGMTVILGVPTFWRTLNNDAVTDQYLHNIIKEGHIVMPWFVARFISLEDLSRRYSLQLRNDLQWLNSNRIEYIPVVYPGFSWSNLEPGSPFDMISRQQGRFLWEQVKIARAAGVRYLFQAMFDEVNEGTNIFKVTDDVPVGGKWLTYEGLGSDFYLKMVGKATLCIKDGQCNFLIAANETKM